MGLETISSATSMLNEKQRLLENSTSSDHMLMLDGRVHKIKKKHEIKVHKRIQLQKEHVRLEAKEKHRTKLTMRESSK